MYLPHDSTFHSQSHFNDFSSNTNPNGHLNSYAVSGV